MMESNRKRACLVAAIALLQTIRCGVASDFGPDQFGETFHPKDDVSIEWKVPPSNLPRHLVIYKAVKPALDSTVLENIKKRFPKNVFVEAEKGAIMWGSEEHYAKMREDPVDVPSIDRAKELAINFWAEMGVDPSQYARKPDGSLTFSVGEYQRSYYHKVSKEFKKSVYARGVFFSRSYGGFSSFGLGGGGGVWLYFADRENICRVEYSWKNLEEKGQVPLDCSQKTMLERIYHGKSYLNVPRLKDIRAFVINELSIYYLETSIVHSQDLVKPIIQLDCVDTATGEKFNLYLSV